ncbi:hypothetical protein, partial [Streptomyces sp. NPDC002690]
MAGDGRSAGARQLAEVPGDDGGRGEPEPEQLGNDWMRDSADASGKWSDGDYLGAVFDWGK